MASESHRDLCNINIYYEFTKTGKVHARDKNYYGRRKRYFCFITSAIRNFADKNFEQMALSNFKKAAF